MERPSVPERVVEALATDIVADPERQAAYMNVGYSALHETDGEQRLAHITALRGLAFLRQIDRQVAQDNGEIFDRRTWQPAPSDLESLQTELAPSTRRLKLINSLDRYIAGEGFTGNDNDLHEHQAEVFKDVARFLSAEPEISGGTKRGYIEMPTGTGKTVVFTKLIEAFNQQEEPVKSLILVPSKDILAQTIGSDGKRGFSEFAGQLNVTSYFQDEKDLSGDVVVMTYQSFNKLMNDDNLPQDFCDVLICDEAHNSLGRVTKQNLQKFSQDKVAIGLTATPEYGSNKHIDQIFDREIHTLDLRESIESGILAPVQCWLYKTDYKVDLDPRITTKFTPQELERLADIEARNRMAVKFAKNFVQQGLQGIISCVPGENVIHPIIVAEMLEKVQIVDKNGERRPIVVEALSGDLNPSQRKDIYDRFEAGEIDVLTYVDLLMEGWDSGAAKFLINLRPTCSPVFNVQRLGRVLRQTADRTQAYVIDFLDDTKKAQHTALHALGEYRYHPEKVFGAFFGGESGEGQKIEIPDELKAQIHAVGARKLREIIINPEYKPTHSELISVTDVAKNLNIPQDLLFNIGRYLGLEFTKKTWSDGKQKMYLEDRHIEMIQSQLRVTAFAQLAKRETTQQQRRQFYLHLFEKVPKDKRAPIIKEVLVEGPRQELPGDIEDFDLVDDEKSSAQTTAPETTKDSSKKQFSIAEISDLLLGTRKLSPEILDTVMQGLAANPHLIVSILAHNGQSKPGAEPVYELSPAKLGFNCTVKVKDHLGQPYEESAQATSKKKAQQLAATKLIASMAGVEFNVEDKIDLSDMTNLQEPLQFLPTENPRSILHDYSQVHGNQATYQTKEVKSIGEYKLFESTLSMKVRGEEVTVTARGLSKRDAETRAALSFIQDNGIERPTLLKKKASSSVAKVKPEETLPKPRNVFYINGESYKIPSDPVVIPHQWQQLTGEEVVVDVVDSEVGQGFYGRITIKKHNGDTEIIEGPVKPSKSKAKRAVGTEMGQRIAGINTSTFSD